MERNPGLAYFYNMKKQIYIETSVWNQFEQVDRPDYAEITERFFNVVREGVYDIFVSDVVFWEIEICEDVNRKDFLLQKIIKYAPVRLRYGEDAEDLHAKYIEAGIMTPTKRNRFYDMAHVAVSTVNRIPYIATFNFLHLLKVAKIESFNGVNIFNGYSAVQLVTPEALIPEEG